MKKTKKADLTKSYVFNAHVAWSKEWESEDTSLFIDIEQVAIRSERDWAVLTSDVFQEGEHCCTFEIDGARYYLRVVCDTHLRTLGMTMYDDGFRELFRDAQLYTQDPHMELLYVMRQRRFYGIIESVEVVSPYVLSKMIV